MVRWPDAKCEVTGKEKKSREAKKKGREEKRSREERRITSVARGCGRVLPKDHVTCGGTIRKPSGLRGDNKETERPAGGQ